MVVRSLADFLYVSNSWRLNISRSSKAQINLWSGSFDRRFSDQEPPWLQMSQRKIHSSSSLTLVRGSKGFRKLRVDHKLVIVAQSSQKKVKKSATAQYQVKRNIKVPFPYIRAVDTPNKRTLEFSEILTKFFQKIPKLRTEIDFSSQNHSKELILVATECCLSSFSRKVSHFVQKKVKNSLISFENWLIFMIFF